MALQENKKLIFNILFYRESSFLKRWTSKFRLPGHLHKLNLIHRCLMTKPLETCDNSKVKILYVLEAKINLINDIKINGLWLTPFTIEKNSLWVDFINGSCPTPNCFHSLPNFWDALFGIKVWRRARKNGVGHKTFNEINPFSDMALNTMGIWIPNAQNLDSP